MKYHQNAHILSTYSADTFGVCSALFELGGMIVMHDPSGCNSTYTTHDEPRWYEQDSLIFISALNEQDAVLGRDDKFVQDVIDSAMQFRPRFICIIPSQIAFLIGTDMKALAHIIANRTGIPCFTLPTNSMHYYERGIFYALEWLAKQAVQQHVPLQKPARKGTRSLNILGVTPLDFSPDSVSSLRQWASNAGFTLQSCWAVGESLDTILSSTNACVNLVVSYGGLGAARVLQEAIGIPYVIGTPIGALRSLLAEALKRSADDQHIRAPFLSGHPIELPVQAMTAGPADNPAARPNQMKKNAQLLVGESICTQSLAFALEREGAGHWQTIVPVETESSLLLPDTMQLTDETDLQPAFRVADKVLADPMYEPIIPTRYGVSFIRLPHAGFSGRLYQKEIPDLISTKGFQHLRKKIK